MFCNRKSECYINLRELMPRLKLSVTSKMLIAALIVAVSVLNPCLCQRAPSLPFNSNSFNQFLRSTYPVPTGRSANFGDVFIRFYGANVTQPSSYHLKEISLLLDNPLFASRRPTILYAHGYIELSTDRSVQRVVRSYLRHDGYNTLVLDWSNMAFGNYITVATNVASVGKETARALTRLLKQGVPIEGLHLVGHSLGAHVLGHAARALAARGYTVPRLTGLDPAYPGFYPPILGQPLSEADAAFVDVIHTDGGGYGAPDNTGHADFWPNSGRAKQPGCQASTIILSDEDFCSHWRSWAFWAESVAGGEFPARRCDSYEAFLRKQCRAAPLASMGLQASPGLRGNFYLRTAEKKPYSLGIDGAS